MTTRKTIALSLLVGISVLLTAAMNQFAGIIYDYARNLYVAGLATLGTSLFLHVFAVRRLLAVRRLATQLLGVAISGVLSITIYDLAHQITAHVTFFLRQGTTINWGDDGFYSGLPALGTGFDIRDFIHHLPVTLSSAGLFAVVWFPLLSLLERWAYDDSSPSDTHHEPLTCDGNAKA